MNDRFRFRAWDNFEKKMISWDECLNNESLIAEFLLNAVRYNAMQCTGLKDKNGRLIYEGDIVRLTRRKDNILQKRGSCFQIRYLTHRFCGFGYGVNNRSVDMCLTERKAKCLEVIGNIHENPELLDDK